MQTQNWIDDVYTPEIPELKPVHERRREIQSLKDKRAAIIAERVKLEIAEKKAHVCVTDDPTIENFSAWVKAREKAKAWYDAEKLMQEMSAHYSDSLEGHHCGAEEILIPALKAVAERVKAKIEKFTAEEEKRLSEHGLDPVESPAIAPLKAYYNELIEALDNLPEWGEDHAQTAWRRFSSLIKR